MIKKHNTLITSEPTLTNSINKTSDVSGLYLSTNTNSGTATYYFRGNVTNNYVLFAGLEWKIIRINEDGTVKLILTDTVGEPVSGAYYSFNTSNSSYSYMYYSNSDTAKPKIDSWYQTNIIDKGYDSYVAITTFCEQAKAKISQEGEYIKLKYMNPVTKKLQDKFPAGTRIGWVLHRSGFQSLTSKVNNGTYQFYSNNEWNPEKTKKNHTAMFTTSKGNLIIGFEDVHNEALLADGDCNDVVIHVASYPHNVIRAKNEIPNIENDKIEEEVDIIQPLNEIIEVSTDDPLIKDIMVASKSTLTIEDNYVVGVKDILYLANTKAMNSLVSKTYTNSEMERKVVVRTTIKFSRAAKRTVVRTTVKNTTWDVEEENSRALFYYEGDDIAGLIEAVVEHYSSKLADGACIRLEVDMTFEPVKYDKFIKNISVPPYSPFIVDAKIKK